MYRRFAFMLKVVNGNRALNDTKDVEGKSVKTKRFETLWLTVSETEVSESTWKYGVLQQKTSSVVACLSMESYLNGNAEQRASILWPLLLFVVVFIWSGFNTAGH